MIREGKVSFMVVVSIGLGFVILFIIVSFDFIESLLTETESLPMVSGKGFLTVSTWELPTRGKVKKIKKRKYEFFILVKI